MGEGKLGLPAGLLRPVEEAGRGLFPGREVEEAVVGVEVVEVGEVEVVEEEVEVEESRRYL